MFYRRRTLIEDRGRTAMYGVPADLNLEPFMGSTLDQIALGAHQVSFRFSGPRGRGTAVLDVEGRWAMHSATGDIIDQSLEPEQLVAEREAYRIHRALGLTVVAFALDPPHSLVLTFDDGTSLTVWDDSKQYESFHIEPGGYHI